MFPSGGKTCRGLGAPLPPSLSASPLLPRTGKDLKFVEAGLQKSTSSESYRLADDLKGSQIKESKSADEIPFGSGWVHRRNLSVPCFCFPPSGCALREEHDVFKTGG